MPAINRSEVDVVKSGFFVVMLTLLLEVEVSQVKLNNREVSIIPAEKTRMK